MSLTPLFAAGSIVVSHATTAFAALGLGTVQLLAPKGTAAHRIVGYAWCALMAWTSVSSFWIHEIRLVGPWSPIHLLSALSLATLAYAIAAARRGRISSHRKAMRALFFFALLLAGAFTLLPGRVMHEVLFGTSGT